MNLPITKLVTVINHDTRMNKLNPMDIQLIQVLAAASQTQLNTVESLWLPLCLPRFDCNAFMHGHLSYLNVSPSSSNEKLCLVLLTTNREDFHKCQLVKDSARDRLSKIALCPQAFSALNIPQLQLFWYQSFRPQSIIWQSPLANSFLKFNQLVHYTASRMIASKLKTFWVRSDQHRLVVLGWHSPSFQLYAQFDVTITQAACLNAAQNIIKWIKKEEEKVIFKDYL